MRANGQRPNIIMLGLDTTPAGHISCYGYPRPTSPNIDRLAREGVMFADASLTGLPTTPGWTSILTGVHPLNSGIVIHAEPPDQHELDARFVFLHETLKEHGYHTAALEGRGKNFRAPYWMRGWDEYLDLNGQEKVYTRGVPAQRMADTAVDWISAHAHDPAPFFLFTHWWDPHWPYLPPGPYDRMFYAGDEKNPLNTSLTKFRRHPWWRARINSDYTGMDPRERAHVDLVRDVTDIEFLTALFDGEIAYMDANIGRVMEALEAVDLASNTLTIVVGDHGESIVEHDMFYKHGDLYQTNVHIPMILHHPDALPVGMQVREVVEHIDIVPTVMDHLAIDAAVPVDGLSLIPAIRGEALQDPAICMTNNNWGMQRAWRSGRWKLIENLGPGHLGSPTGWLELYDLQLDPDERPTLWPAIASWRSHSGIGSMHGLSACWTAVPIRS